jgi:hypothetical protein
MNVPNIGLRSLIATALVLGLAQFASAGIIYVTDTNGNVWQYANMAQMALQTQTNNAGTLVRDASLLGGAYASDQDATADLNTGIVYRINAAGDIISYPGIAEYLGNINSTTVAAAVYGGTKKINGLSFDGNTGGFYAVPATGSTNAGDIIRFATLADFIAGVPTNTSLTTANYTGNLLNFYDPDGTPGTTVGNPPSLPSKSINARYYQVAGNGRLEGFESLADYNSSSNNRINITGTNAFGGTTPTFTAVAAFAIAVPEPTSITIFFLAVCGAAFARHRRRG